VRVRVRVRVRVHVRVHVRVRVRVRVSVTNCLFPLSLSVMTMHKDTGRCREQRRRIYGRERGGARKEYCV